MYDTGTRHDYDRTVACTGKSEEESKVARGDGDGGKGGNYIRMTQN